MDIERMKSKIKKLLALSQDNPSDEESYSALMKAQALMAEYKIGMKDLSDDEKEKCIKKKTNLSYGTRSSDHYLSTLADIIADNFCCVTYVSTPRGTRTRYICFMGNESDVSICEEALMVANAAIIRGYNRVWKSMRKEYDLDYIPAKYFNPAKVGYIEGYLDGLRAVLEEQRDKNQEWGLVLVAPQEAQEFVGSLDHYKDPEITYIDNTYYGEGYDEGKRFNLNKKLNNESGFMIEGN